MKTWCASVCIIIILAICACSSDSTTTTTPTTDQGASNNIPALDTSGTGPLYTDGSGVEHLDFDLPESCLPSDPNGCNDNATHYCKDGVCVLCEDFAYNCDGISTNGCECIGACTGAKCVGTTKNDTTKCKFEDVNVCGGDVKKWCKDNTCTPCQEGRSNCDRTKDCECEGQCRGLTCR